MPRDPLTPTAAERAAALNDYARGVNATDIVRDVVTNPYVGKTALVSSFGAESVVLLHMVAQVAPWTPILFIDTRMLFDETLKYQRDVADFLALTDVRKIRARHLDLATDDPADDLNTRNTDACCDLRKTQPLKRAVAGFDGWMTGRKRFQSGTRAALNHFEAEDGRIKINPLAAWGPKEIASYMDRHDLPRHPLVAQGYPSIGCAPCTSPVKPGEDARAGRWRGETKEECGIHFVDGKMVRGGPSAHTS